MKIHFSLSLLLTSGFLFSAQAREDVYANENAENGIESSPSVVDKKQDPIPAGYVKVYDDNGQGFIMTPTQIVIDVVTANNKVYFWNKERTNPVRIKDIQDQLDFARIDDEAQLIEKYFRKTINENPNATMTEMLDAYDRQPA